MASIADFTCPKPEWLSWLALVMWSLSGLMIVLHYNLATRSQRAITYFIYRLLRYLRSAPRHMLSRLATTMHSVSLTVYGTSVTSLVLAGLFISLFYSSVILWIGYRHSSWSREYRDDKLAVEAAVDPYLWEHRDEIPRARDVTVSLTGDMAWFTHEDPMAKDIRHRIHNFRLTYPGRVRTHANADALSLLTLFDGTYVDRGTAFTGIALALLFNLPFDLASAALMLASLRRLATRSLSLATYCAITAAWLLATAALFLSVLLAYAAYTTGDHNVFRRLVVVLFTVVGTALVFHGQYFFDERVKLRVRLTWLIVWTLLGTGLFGWFAFRDLLVPWTSGSIPPLRTERGWNWLPYALSADSVGPSGLFACAIVIAIVVRLASEMILRPTVWYLRLALRRAREKREPLLWILAMVPSLVVQFVERALSIMCQP